MLEGIRELRAESLLRVSNKNLRSLRRTYSNCDEGKGVEEEDALDMVSGALGAIPEALGGLDALHKMSCRS